MAEEIVIQNKNLRVRKKGNYEYIVYNDAIDRSEKVAAYLGRGKHSKILGVIVEVKAQLKAKSNENAQKECLKILDIVQKI